MEELREENAELREDNDKLVAYLESLERKKKDLEEFAAQAQGGGAEPPRPAQLLTMTTETVDTSQSAAVPGMVT